MRVLLITLPLALAACGDGKKDSGTLDSSAIRTGSGESATTAPSTTGAPTEADVKAFVERKVKALATGVGGSHSEVTIDFDTVQIAGAEPINTQQKYDGARGDQVWPVRVRWTEHRKWGNGETDDPTTYYDYTFYRNSFGEWDAIGNGPVR